MKCILKLAAAILVFVSWTIQAPAQSASRQAGYLYLSPVPDAPYTSPQTRFVLVRLENASPSEVTNLTTTFITVQGASSGIHPGTTHVASDGRTVIFQMSTDFSQTELVTVTLNPQLASGSSGTVEPYAYQFMINGIVPGGVLPIGLLSAGAARTRETTPMIGVKPPGKDSPFDDSTEEPQTVEIQASGEAVIMPNGVSVPSDFPKITVNVNNDPSSGYLFLENGRNIHPGFSMIVDNNGMPVWYHRGWIQDLRLQDNGMITWHTVVSGHSEFTSFDKNFNYSNSFNTVNGYTTDGHEFVMLPDNGYLMLGYRTHSVDMSQFFSGGRTSATVTETVIQEFTAAGELIFQWRSWDHYDIRDLFAITGQATGFDFTHMNALDIDDDGNMLVSSRHLLEITKIDRNTGDIIWRLSGPKSDFTFINDSFNGLSAQHHITALGNSRYLIFDNGNSRTPLVSRAVEYQLNLTNMTATLAWEFRDKPDKYTYYMGSAQRLQSGNTLINFVLSSYPKAIEVDSNGVKRFEISLSPNSDAYRAYRFPWDGVVAAPYLILEPESDNVTLIFNKFGDHSVDHYRIYGGTSPAPTNLVGISSTTLKRLTNVVNGAVNYFRVTAVSTNGVESDFSNEESLMINITVPGANMVSNGDFSQGTSRWTWTVTPPASAQLDTGGGSAHFQIISGGSYITDVQLKQAGMHLTQGREYTLSFDAWSAAPRIFEAKVEQNTSNGINYSGIQPFNLVPTPQTYKFTFTMNSPSDNNARLVFNAGVLPHDLYIDNVSLTERVYAPGDFNTNGRVGFEDLKVLTQEWKDQGALPADLNGDGKVNFQDFVIFSEGWSGNGF